MAEENNITDNIEIEDNNIGIKKLSVQRNIEMLVIVLFLYILILNLSDLIPTNLSRGLAYAVAWGYYIIKIMPAFIARLIQKKKFDEGYKFTKWSVVTIIGLLILKVVSSIILDRTGLVIMGKIYVVRPVSIIMTIINYIFFVAVTEEYMYRIYVQETLLDLLGKCKVLAPLLSALVFGLMHAVLGSWINAIYNVFVGIIWGYMRYFNKNYNFVAMVLTHGLSNVAVLIMGILI